MAKKVPPVAAMERKARANERRSKKKLAKNQRLDKAKKESKLMKNLQERARKRK